jgi:hypothetical protein
VLWLANALISVLVVGTIFGHEARTSMKRREMPTAGVEADRSQQETRNHLSIARAGFDQLS